MVDLLRVDRVAQALAHSQVGRLGSRGQVTYRDPDVLHMTEAGLVVSYAPGWVEVSEPSHLSREQLLELSELCRKLRDKFQEKLDA